MKIVFDPETEQVIEIDEKKEPDRKKKYWHRSGKPFDGEVSDNTVNLEDLGIETLREIYKDKLGKNVSNRYKNNKEWILEQLL